MVVFFVVNADVHSATRTCPWFLLPRGFHLRSEGPFNFQSTIRQDSRLLRGHTFTSASTDIPSILFIFVTPSSCLKSESCLGQKGLSSVAVANSDLTRPPCWTNICKRYSRDVACAPRPRHPLKSSALIANASFPICNLSNSIFKTLSPTTQSCPSLRDVRSMLVDFQPVSESKISKTCFVGTSCQSIEKQFLRL